MAKLFFMITPLCRSFTGSCTDEDFVNWGYKAGYESQHSPEPIWKRILWQLRLGDCLRHEDLDADLSRTRKLELDSLGDLQEVEKLASVVIAVAPCMRLIKTAAVVCTQASGATMAKARLLNFSIHVDDRLNCSCSNTDDNRHRLGALVSYWRASESSHWYGLQDQLHLTRIEQCVYHFQQELPLDEDVGKLDHIFNPDASRVDLTMPVAAILIIAEDQEAVRIFEKLPLVQTPGMPTAGQFYNFGQRRSEWRRQFLGSYRIEESLQLRVSAASASVTANPSSLQFRPITPVSQAPNNKKRKLSDQDSSVASRNDELYETVILAGLD
jgi:hypothetical protein